MAKVRVRFFATFREVTGRPESWEDANDVSGLLDVLASRHGEKFSRLIRTRDADSFVVLVNGSNVRQLDGLDTGLEDGDEVSLFPPVSGG